MSGDALIPALDSDGEYANAPARAVRLQVSAEKSSATSYSSLIIVLMLAKLINFFWALLAVGVILLFTHMAVTSLYKGDLQMGALFVLIQVPAYYFVLSVYFEHVLERRFRASTRHMPALQPTRVITGGNIVDYCRTRREVLRDVLDKLDLSEPFYRRLCSVHETLGLACLVEVVILVVWGILQHFA